MSLRQFNTFIFVPEIASGQSRFPVHFHARLSARLLAQNVPDTSNQYIFPALSSAVSLDSGPAAQTERAPTQPTDQVLNELAVSNNFSEPPLAFNNHSFPNLLKTTKKKLTQCKEESSQ